MCFFKVPGHEMGQGQADEVHVHVCVCVCVSEGWEGESG